MAADRDSIALSWPKDGQFQIPLEVLEHVAIRERHVLRRNACDARHHIFDLTHGHRRFAIFDRLQPQVRAGLVDHVDRLVRHVPIVDMPRRELRGRLQRVVFVLDPMVLFVPGLEAPQNIHRVLHRGLGDVDFLEAPRQRVVLLENAAVLVVGRGTDAAQLAVGQGGLDEVRGIHDAARSRTGADDGMNLIDEQNGAGLLLDLGQHRLEALLEVAAVLGARHQRTHVQRVNGGIQQHVGDLIFHDHARQPLGNGGLAHAGLAHVQRIVLAPTAQDLDGALHLELAADQGIDLSLARGLVQIGGVFLQRVAAAVAIALGFARGCRPLRVRCAPRRRPSTSRGR
jgi:hypothetical protein